MSTPEKNPEDLFAKRLQERFDGFAPQVDESVRRRIFGSIAGASNYYYLGTAIIACLLGLLYVSGNIQFGGAKEKRVSLSKVKKPSHSEVRGGIVLNDIKSKPIETQAASAYIADSILERKNTEPSQNETIERKLSLNPSSQLPVQPTSIEVTEQMGTLQTDIQTAVEKEILLPEKHEDQQPAQSDLDLLKGTDASFRKIDFAQRIAAPSIDSADASGKDKAASPAEWVFSAGALPTFQIVHLNSLPELSYQNVKFAPFLSSRSISYKVSAGIEKNKLQLLLSYGYLRNWNTYEIGGSRIKVDRKDDQSYTAVPLGEQHKIDEQLHLLGLAVRRTLLLPQNFAGLNRVSIGAEYTRVWPTGQNMYWGSITLARQIVSAKHSTLQLGPYAQYSFSKRAVGAYTWRSQPYQIGLTLEVKLKR